MTMNQSNLFASHTLPPTSQLTSLLVKRKLNTDLADILVKKLKTDSTSETISTEGSPASKNDSNEEGFFQQSQSKSNAGSTVEEDDGSSDLECGETFETMIASTSPSNSDDASQLYQALEFLKTKFLFQRELANSKLLAAPREEEFFIPAFRDPAENAVVEEEAVEKKEEEMKAEKKNKTEANSLDFIYGDVEFPFLSISVPYTEFSDFKLPPLSTSFIQSKEVMKPKEKKVKEEKKLIFKVERDDAKKSDSLKNMKLKTQETKKKVLITSQKMIMKQKKLRKEKEEKKKEAVCEQAVQIQKIMTELKTQKTNSKEKTKEIKEKVKVEEKETISYFRHAKKNSRRQKNRWQVAQDEMLLRNGLPLPSQAKEIDFMFVGTKKKAGLTQVGDDCQADMAVSEKKRTEKRVPKLRWDPSAVNEKELQIYFKEVKTVTRQNYVEEAAIELVVENNHDMKEALQFIKTNKAECLKKLKIKPNSDMEIEY